MQYLIWPTKSHSINSGFGYRSFQGPEVHDGIDISKNGGLELYAVADGTVTEATNGHGYGNYISLNIGGGLTAFYGHCASLKVKKGQKVKQGDVIGIMGNTGHSFGVHLHFSLVVSKAYASKYSMVTTSNKIVKASDNSAKECSCYTWRYCINPVPYLNGSVSVNAKTQVKRQYLGKFDITAYCPCSKCCGKYANGITATGTKAKANHTIAVDPKVIPYGSVVEIEGKRYVAEDCGGAIKGARIDIFYNTHSEALSSGYGHKMCDVYLLQGATSDNIDDYNIVRTSFNIEKKSVDNIPDFNKAEKSKMLRNWKNTQGMLLKIIHQNIIYDVSNLCYGDVQLVTKRRATPGKLTFKIARDVAEAGTISFEEGDAVCLMYNETDMFWGYIFKKQRTKEQIITVTAYDQTRYLKAKDTYCYSKTASELIKTICSDYKLQVGSIADTEYMINERVEDNQSLLDIIYTALDFTNIYTGKGFIFYDDFGDITLKSYDEMNTNMCFLSDSDEFIDFNYSTDIDTNTYNRVVLYRDNSETGSREVYVSQDSINEIKYGILTYTEKVSDSYSESQIQDLANRYLALYNRLNRSLTIERTGIATLRAGMSVYLQIDDVGEKLYRGCMIESCTHTFSNNEHNMKLELICNNENDVVNKE
ncbi:MAG: peptidoglycan DD-metalloendopeptidase family protein [Lachnospirales bacterium]